jgi:hypothetical protein
LSPEHYAPRLLKQPDEPIAVGVGLHATRRTAVPWIPVHGFGSRRWGRLASASRRQVETSAR